MLAYLQLLRLPTVFTAMADIVLGFVLTHRFVYGPLNGHSTELLDTQIGWNDPASFFGLLASSCCLYLSGMVFNDVFDRKQDAEERPGRPIPSGRVPLKSAIILGTALMSSGVALAGFVGFTSLQVALLLVVAILGYDGILKHTLLGPLAMGSCRFLNVMLGGSVMSGGLSGSHGQLLLTISAGLGIYITGVTIFARTEAKISSRWQLRLAAFVMNIGLALLVVTTMKSSLEASINVPSFGTVAMLLCVIAFTINRRAIFAIRDPSPATVQGSIKILLLSLVMIDASLVYWYSNIPEALGYDTVQSMATASLVIPAMFLGRFIPMT